MDFESAGMGAGGGVLATVLAALGFRDRLKKLEDKVDKFRTEASCRELRESCTENFCARLDRIENSITGLSDRIDRILNER